MSFPIPRHNTHLLETSEIIDDILAFPKIDFLQGMADFYFLVLDHAAEIGDMACGGFEGEVLFDLGY